MLIGLSPLALALLLVAGIALDLLLGEVRRWHPLVGFGRLASFLERRLNVGNARLLRGAGAWMLAVLPLSLCFAALADAAGLWLHALLLYVCIGLRSLRERLTPLGATLDACADGNGHWIVTAHLPGSGPLSATTRETP